MYQYHENFIKILLNPYTSGEVIIEIKLQVSDNFYFQVIKSYDKF